MRGGSGRAALTSLLINAVLFGTFFSFASPRFETNDDVQMMLIASGAHTGHPSEFLIFSSLSIGGGPFVPSEEGVIMTGVPEPSTLSLP